MEEKKKKALFSKSRIIFYVLSILIFIFVAYYFTEIKKDIKLFKKIDPYWLMVSVLGQVGTYFFGALIYQQLLRGSNIRLKQTIWKLLQVSLVTLFFNQTVPSAGISGNTFFFNFLHKKKIAVNHIISLISVELLSFYASAEIIIMLIVILSIFFLRMPGTFYIILGAGFIVYLLFGLAVDFFSKKQTINAVLKKIRSIKLLTKLADKFKESFPVKTHIERPSKFFQQHRSVVLQATGLQFLVFLSDAITILTLVYGFGLNTTLLVVSAGLILTRIISLLPISPGGLILYEGGMVYFFSNLGVSFNSAIVVTLLYRALSFWLPMVFGFFLYKKLQNE
jgi:uncharacterized protein (TIRG00374 family)